MPRAATLLLLVSTTSAFESWTCAGPAVGAHGARQGALSVGAFMVQDATAFEYIDTDETYTVAPGAVVTFEVAGLSSTDTFVGFMFDAASGSLAPASSNAEAYAACAPAVKNSGETAQSAAKADWTLPTTPGTYELTVYVLQDASAWWSSTFSYRVAAGDDDEESGSLRRPVAAAIFGVGLALWAMV
mmetsp:Transcript_7624/g.23993  ORF Transcript_7624/g.23993 Transcript_7624/m.23993 type:complete len:187 (-) Transcript_7624:49-609(-)